MWSDFRLSLGPKKHLKACTAENFYFSVAMTTREVLGRTVPADKSRQILNTLLLFFNALLSCGGAEGTFLCLNAFIRVGGWGQKKDELKWNSPAEAAECS